MAKVYRIILIFLLFTTEAQADSILYFCCSVHHGNADNEIHHGILYEREISDSWRFTAGTYQNSQDNRTLLIGFKYEITISENWDAFMTAGYVTGYGSKFGGMPGFEYKDRIQLYVVPGVVYGVGLTVLTW